MVDKDVSYELHLASDLHIGSGVGLPGIVDEYVVRDQDDLAGAPFSEVKGIVRDSCVRLMQLLGCYDWQTTQQRCVCAGQHQLLHAGRLGRASPRGLCGLRAGPAPDVCALCALFGSPSTPGWWWFSPATYKQDYRDAIGRIGKLAGGGTNPLAWRDSAGSAHAAIDPGTKRAAEGQLFNLEVVRLPSEGAALQAVWEGQILWQPGTAAARCRCSDDQLVGWLLASLLFTRRLGGRRRRGWGRCRFAVTQPKSDALAAQVDRWLQSLPAAPAQGNVPCSTAN